MMYPLCPAVPQSRILGRVLTCAFLVMATSLQAADPIEYTDGEIDGTSYASDPVGTTRLLSIASGDAATQSGDLTGAGSFTLTGGGDLTLTGDNTYSGGTVLQQGILRLANTGSMSNDDEILGPVGSGLVTFSGGSLGTSAEGGMIALLNNVESNSDFSLDVQGAENSLEFFGDTFDMGAATTRTISLTGAGLACFGGVISGQNITFQATNGPSQLMFCSDTINLFTGLLTLKTGVYLELWKVADAVAVQGNVLIEAGATVDLLVGNQFQNTSDLEINGTLRGSSNQLTTIDVLTGAGTITSDMGDTLAVNSGVFSGQITGDQAILKQNGGTLVLSGTSSYTGGTTITGGTLQAQNNKALGTGSVSVSGGATLRVDAGVALDVGANRITIANDGVTTYRKDFASGEAFTNFNAITSSGPNMTQAQILAGEAADAHTVEATFDTAPSTPASNDAYRISDVFSLSGTDGDTFVLQLSYTQDAYNNAASAGLYDSERELILGRLAAGEWVALGDGGAVNGAWDPSYTTLGAHGVDTINNTVWVVTNQGGEISVVPEPSTWVLFGLGLALVLVRLRRVVCQS